MASYLPTREGELLTWSTNFESLITAGPATYGLDVAQATAYNALHVAYRDAYVLSINNSTRTPSVIAAKRNAKAALIGDPNGIRALVRIIQAFPGTTDQMRSDLGITIPDSEPSPVPVPTVPPDLSIMWTMGRTVQVRLRDQENPDSRGKPEGVQGATLLYHVGENAPDDPTLWIFLENTSRTLFDATIPGSVPAGSRVWLTAFWFNTRKESSPAAMPESTRIADQLSQAA